MDNSEAEKIESPNAPKVVGPYSQAVKFGNMVFCSGQIGIDPLSGQLVNGGIGEEARQVLKNLSAVLEGAGSNFSKVMQVTIYITDMSKYAEVNAIYAECFKTQPLPARATVQVAALPAGGSVEISCIGYI